MANIDSFSCSAPYSLTVNAENTPPGGPEQHRHPAQQVLSARGTGFYLLTGFLCLISIISFSSPR